MLHTQPDVSSNNTSTDWGPTGSDDRWRWVLSGYTLPLAVGMLTTSLIMSRLTAPPGGRRRPPGPFPWPLVGNIYSLGRSPHLTLTRLAETYGSVFRFRLGAWDTVVITGYDAVREALVANGDAFASRPPFDSYQYYSEGLSMSFCPYGDVLQGHRRVTGRVITDTTALPATTHIIHTEALALRRRWSAHAQSRDLGGDLVVVIANIMYSVCFGASQRLSDNADLCDVLLAENPGTELFAAGNQTDFMPWMRHVTQRAAYHRNIARMRRLVRINDVTVRRCQRNLHDDGHSILGGLLLFADRVSDNKRSCRVSARRLQNTAVEFMSAGTETSSATLQWLLLYMAKHPDVQERACAEIAHVLGRDTLPVYQHRYDLPYTEACVLEVMRMSTVVPFALPHYTTRDAVLQGHHVAKDTVIWVNLWSVNRDRKLWGPDPDNFRPERFLCGGRVDRQVASRSVPFSVGRRRCIGEQLGRMQVFVLFVSILQHFKVASPSPGGPNMAAKFGDILKPEQFRLEMTQRDCRT